LHEFDVKMSEVYPVTVFVTKGEITDEQSKARIVISKDGSEIELFVEGTEKSSPLREVKIKRNNNGFGISIKGGKEHNRPIIISKCDPRHKEIRLGDRIISCNSRSMLNSFHKEAVDAIKAAGETVTLQVQGENWVNKTFPIEVPPIYREVTESPFWLLRLSRASKYGENSIELASGDLSTRFVIKAETEPIADMFVRTFQRAKNSISQAAFKKLNHLLNQKSAFEYFDQNLKDLTTPGCSVHNMDWFHCPHDKKHYLIALTDYELRLYYSLPTDWSEWDRPVKSIPLLGTRTVIFRDNLLLRTGTRKEVEILELKCSSVPKWKDEIQSVTRDCVSKVNEAQVEVIYEKETCFLGIHVTEGLRLYKPTNTQSRKLVWHKSISALSKMDDDSQSSLTLEFKDKSKFTFVLGDGLRQFIFVMLNFVEAQFNNNNNLTQPC